MCTNFVRMYIFFSLGCVPRSRIIASYSKSIFNNLRQLQTFFLKELLCFTFPSLYPHQQLLLSILLIPVFLVGVKLYVLWCWFVFYDDYVEYLFMFLLAICIFIWRTVSLDSLLILKLGYACFYYRAIRVSGLFWVQIPYQIYNL